MALLLVLASLMMMLTSAAVMGHLQVESMLDFMGFVTLLMGAMGFGAGLVLFDYRGDR